MFFKDDADKKKESFKNLFLHHHWFILRSLKLDMYFSSKKLYSVFQINSPNHNEKKGREKVTTELLTDSQKDYSPPPGFINWPD